MESYRKRGAGEGAVLEIYFHQTLSDIECESHRLQFEAAYHQCLRSFLFYDRNLFSYNQYFQVSNF